MSRATAIIAAGLEAALDQVLRLDPDIRSRLAALEGKVIAIEPEGLGLTLYLLPGVTGIRVVRRRANRSCPGYAAGPGPAMARSRNLWRRYDHRG